MLINRRTPATTQLKVQGGINNIQIKQLKKIKNIRLQQTLEIIQNETNSFQLGQLLIFFLANLYVYF